MQERQRCVGCERGCSVVCFWRRCASRVVASGGLSTKYDSHSYSAEIVTFLSFFLHTPVCDLYRYVCGLESYCEPFHP